MDWLVRTFSSSIGKKQIMAFSGLIFCSFLAVHLIGNLFIYGGKDVFNAYSETLHSLGLLITLAEWSLLILALIHIVFAIILYFENLCARPVRYVVNNNAGGRTIGSRLMPYTGLYMILFLVLHLIKFHFADRIDKGIFEIVTGAFSSPANAVFYIFSMAVIGVHIKHGFWSAFQSFGLNHPKYMPVIQGASWLISIIVGAGFGIIPLLIISGLLGGV